MMNVQEIGKRVEELRGLARMKEELENEITALQDEIKAEMTEQNTDTLTGADWKVTWKEVTSSRIDTTAFKKSLPELAKQFIKVSTSRRFCLA